MTTATPEQIERAWRGFDRITIADEVGMTPDGLAWNQAFFRNRCGTGCCYAGHVAIEFGARWVVDIDPVTGEYSIDGTPITRDEWAAMAYDAAEYVHAEPDDLEHRIRHLRGMPVVHVSHRAERLLGLEGEMHELFVGDNGRDLLQNLITDRFGPRPANVGGTDIEGV